MMHARTALVLAMVAGGLAIAVVAVDLQFGLHVEIQERVDGDWKAVTGSPYEYRLGSCAGQELRLVVNNDWILGTDVPVSISYFDARDGMTVSVLDDVWHLGPGDVRDHAFTIPDEAFRSHEEGKAALPSMVVSVWAGDQYFDVCVEPAEADA